MPRASLHHTVKVVAPVKAGRLFPTSFTIRWGTCDGLKGDGDILPTIRFGNGLSAHGIQVPECSDIVAMLIYSCFH